MVEYNKYRRNNRVATLVFSGMHFKMTQRRVVGEVAKHCLNPVDLHANLKWERQLKMHPFSEAAFKWLTKF
jgi:hypothetical protein